MCIISSIFQNYALRDRNLISDSKKFQFIVIGPEEYILYDS